MYNHKKNRFQPDNFNAAPDGNLWMIKDYSEDYSKAGAEAQASLLHEMTHIWQIQNNTRNLTTEAIKEVYKALKKAKSLKQEFSYAMTSQYTLEQGKDLNEYAYEQQAGIIEDFTRVSNGISPLYNEAAATPSITRYQAVLGRLQTNPAYARRKKKSFFSL